MLGTGPEKEYPQKYAHDQCEAEPKPDVEERQ